MVCYDGFFPEVARRLSNNGAEVIRGPFGAATPCLARRARARITCTSSAALIRMLRVTG